MHHFFEKVPLLIQLGTRFTKTQGQIKEKLAILRLVKSHAENNGWRFESMTRQETLQQLNLLIRFCERAKAKGLNLWVWA